jgi:hypothetical protein
MKQRLRFMPLVVVAAAAIAFGASPASGGNGSTVLQATVASGMFFDVNGVPTLYLFTCNENRVQRQDGSATESMNCLLDPGQTPPSKAVQVSPPTPGLFAGWFSDFFLNGVPGFTGSIFTTDYHGVLAPSGVVNFSAAYAAP